MGAPPRRRAPSTAWHWARLCVRKSGLWVATALVSVGMGLLSLLSPTFAPAQSVPDQLIFGPQQYLRTTGPPNEYTNTVTVPASVGAPFQLHIVNGQANGQNRISSAWVKINGVQVAGPSDFGQNVAVVDKTITLNAGSNTPYVKVASAPGSYLTISVFGTQTLPTPTSLAPNPLNLTIGATGTLTATLSPSPTQAGTLTVASSQPVAATVPASVAFAIGQTSVPMPVTAVGVGVGSTQVTVSLNSGSASSTVQVTPTAPTLTSLAPQTLTITQGATSPLTVTISAAQSTPTTVSVASSASGIASVPGTVTVLAGQTTVPIPVAANTPGQAQITASLNGTSAASMVTVTPALPTVVSLLPPTNPVQLGATITLTVTISAAQPADTTVALAASPAGIVSVPATVTVVAGQTTAPVLVGTVTLGTAMVTASLNGTSAAAAVQVTPPPPAVVSLTPSPLTLAVNATTQMTVTLNVAQPTNTDVTLTVDAPSILQVPPSVTVPANQLATVFTVTGLAVGDATVTATVGSSSKTALVHVIPPAPVAVSLLPSSQSIQQGATGTLTFTINAAQLTDTVVLLTNSDATVLQVPPSVTVPAGQTSAPLAVIGLTPGTATVSATLDGVTVSATVTVTQPPTLVTGITPATLSLPKGKPGTLRVTVSPAPPAATDVTLTSSDASRVSVNSMVVVPAGSLFADFPVLAVSEGSAVITASLNGSTATATVTVTPAEVVMLTLAPQNPAAYVGESVPFTAIGTFTDGSTQNVTTLVTWTSSDETKAIINSGGVATALAVGSTTITASINTSMGPVTASTTLTVNPPPQMLLIPSTATLQVGENVSLTLDAGAPAGTGGLTVTLAQNGTGTVTVPSSVVVPEGQQTVPVIVTGATAGTVTLTASATGRLSATATLTVTPGVPSITSFSPLTGPVGTTVTITGTSFNPVAANNQVKFNGTSAIITSVTSTGTQIVTTVPQGATTGPITVTTAVGTGTSATNFTVTGADFTISALPAPLAISSVGQSAFAVSLSGTGGFTNLATLSVSGAPAGLTAIFSASTLTTGQSAFLTITTNGTTAVGIYPLTINAVGVVNGTPTTRSAMANVQVGGAGATTLSGQVLDEDAKPVKNALVKLGTLQVSTDDGGNFLLQNPPAGVGQLLFIDGGPASTPTHNFPIIPYKITIVAGQNNSLGFIAYLHFQKTTGLVDISNSTVERIVTDPEIPGFQMTLPVGATITGWDGQPNNQISIRRVPLDRVPLPPLPADLVAPMVYMDYFGKPGGGTPSEPIPITAPNDLEADPGTQVELWFYDEAPDGSRPNQWAQYGTGTVSSDGSQIIPDINPATGKPYGQPRFCCGAFVVARRATENPPGAHGNGTKGGDPVDLSTGLFILQKTDLVLPGRFPVTFARFYRPNAPDRGPFGVGASHTYQVRLVMLPTTTARTLLMPDGARAVFSQQPDGTYRTTNAPAYRGAVLTQTPSGHTLHFKDGTTWTFGPTTAFFAYLIGQTDRNGNTITLTRDGNNLLTELTDSVGRKLTFTYDAAGRITQIADPLGRMVTYTYSSSDASARVATVTDPSLSVTRYTYDAVGRMATLTDGRGITFLTNEYDSANRVSRQTQADGGVWQFAYTTSGSLVTQTTVTDPQGHKQTTRFNGIGYDLGRTDGQGQSSATTRDATTNLAQATTDSLGRKTTYEYDASGNVTKITDPNNQVTRFEYEPTFNRVTKITDALNQVTEFTYDPANGNLLTTKDPLNHVTTIAYNSFGQPTSVQGPIPSEPPTTFAYDADGNLITTTDPLGNTTQRAYDAVSRLTTLTDPRGLTTQFDYDALNRVQIIADAAQGLTRFFYDANGNLTQVMDAKGQATNYTYDPMDRLATRKDALNRTESYQYDVAGNLTQFTDRKNQVTTFTYDSLNRRIGASYADSSSTAFTYDAVGRLTKAFDSIVGAIDFLYDSLDRLIKEVSAQGVVEYTYDALGRRTTMTANGATPVSYGYDAASRLIQVAQAGLVVGLQYDAAGRRTGLTYPNGTNTTYSYDNASRLMNIAHNGPAGLIESLGYTYDAAGNRISLTRMNGTASNLPAAVQAAYDAANEQTTFNSLPATFDANGNQTTITDASGTTTYMWDARNRMVAMSGPGVTATFQYDALGRRISKTINGVTTSYLYDGNDIVQEIGGSAVGASYVRSLSIDEPFVRQMATGNEFYHTDTLGSSLAQSNAAGATTVSYSYEAFGKTTMTGTSSNPFQYTGRENDGTGLYYYRARYYRPTSQRFIGEDPISSPLRQSKRCQQKYTPRSVDLAEVDRSLIRLLMLRYQSAVRALGLNPQKLHAYAYADNAPLNKLDPMGLLAGPQLPGCDRVTPVAQYLSCSFDCCDAHDTCYANAKSWCDETNWTDPINEYKRPDCWDCNRAAIGCFLYNATNIGSRKPCNLAGFP